MKIFYGAACVAAVITGTLGLMLYDMSTMDIESLILCSANEGGIRIPSALCERYMTDHRLTDADIRQLGKNAGLEYILNLENPAKYEMAKKFISKGLDINGVNHYSDKKLTPLQASVLYNDTVRVKFLIIHGADVHRRNQTYDMTALELAKKLHVEQGKENRHEIIKLLTEAVKISH